MRYYSSIAVDTSLTSQINSSTTSIIVDSVTGYPTQFPFTIVIDPDTANEELCEVSAVAGTTMTVTRAFDGTTAVAHSIGAAVKHVLSASDLAEPQEHIAASSEVHGLATSSAVVGTLDAQTVKRKSLTSVQEARTVSASAATGTINFDWLTQGVLHYTTDASADFTLNVRGNNSTTLASLLSHTDVNRNSITIAFLANQGSTAYNLSGIQIDGNAQTIKWAGGVAATGTASGIDAYTVDITKTGSSTWSVLAQKVSFA